MVLGPQFGGDWDDPSEDVNQHFWQDSLFHGTHKEIPGDAVLPPVKSGVNSHYSHIPQAHVNAFATTEEHEAWSFANMGRGTKDRSRDRGRTRVYEVEPHAQMEMGDYHPNVHKFGGETFWEWKAPHFPVRKRIDIMPGQQGTFPDVNWERHAVQGRRYTDDYNHPEDHEIEHGHDPSSTAYERDRDYQEGVSGYHAAHAIKEQIEDPKQGSFDGMPGYTYSVGRGRW